MAIEVIVGLPGLSEGPLLARARAMQVPVLVSANSFSRWDRRNGSREWRGWRLGSLANAHGLASVDLDSAGFVLAVRERGIPWTIDDYIALASSHPFRRFASLDLCVEQAVAHDRDEVLDRIARTIQLNRACHMRACDAGIAHRFMPVLQGRLPEDFLRSFDGVADLIPPGQPLGVGSMCRRHLHGPEGLIAVIELLDRRLPKTLQLHLFGVKGSALPSLAVFGDRVASTDSQAYGIAARQSALMSGRSKTNLFVAHHMARWTGRQLDRLREPAPAIQHMLDLSAVEPQNPDPWAQALAHARQQIRDLIEQGEIGFEQITDAWILEWAADQLDAA